MFVPIAFEEGAEVDWRAWLPHNHIPDTEGGVISKVGINGGR